MIPSRHLKIAAQLLRELNLPPSDRLPYTPEFEIFHCEFLETLGHEIPRSEVWEAIVGARKRGLVGSTRRRAVKASISIKSH